MRHAWPGSGEESACHTEREQGGYRGVLRADHRTGLRLYLDAALLLVDLDSTGVLEDPATGLRHRDGQASEVESGMQLDLVVETNRRDSREAELRPVDEVGGKP